MNYYPYNSTNLIILKYHEIITFLFPSKNKENRSENLVQALTFYLSG